MRVHLAYVYTTDGINLYAARNEPDLLKQIAAYCVEWWEDVGLHCEHCDDTGETEGIGGRMVPCEACAETCPRNMTWMEIINTYFSHSDTEFYGTGWEDI